MNSPFHKAAEAVEQSFANFDRRIALSFGVLILALMVIVLLAGGFYYRDFAEREQDKLSTLVTQILAKSVNRISFSGKYHSRLLLEEIARNEPGIRYISVADKQGNVLASSDPLRNDTQLDQRAREAAGKVLLGQLREIRDFRIHDDPVREITVPYLSGLDNEIDGVIQVGLLDRDRSTAFRHGLLIVGTLVLFLMIVGIAVTRAISLRFGRPVIRLAGDLSATLQAIPDLMFELDQDGRYLNVMATREKLLAAPGELLLGRTVREMLPEQAANTVMKALVMAAESGSAYGLEISMPLEEGTGWFELSVAKKAVAAGGMPRYIVLSRDITGRKLAEAEIRKLNAELEQRVQERTRELAASEERMRQFFERQLVGMAITSPEKGWVEVNDKVCEMLGYSREELLHLSWAEMTYPEDLAADVAQFERLLRGEIDSYMLEKRFVRKDSSIVFTNLAVGCVRRVDRSVDYVLVLLEDISSRKQMELTLQKSDFLFKKAQELGKIGGWDWDTTSNESTWSEQVYRIHEISLDEPPADRVAKSIECYRPQDRPVINAAFRDCLEKGISYDLEFPFKGYRGTDKWIRTGAIPQFAGDKVTHVYGYIMDISEHKRAEVQIRMLNQDLQSRALALEAANKELESFSYSISHDLRTPLRAIDGYSHILLDDYAGKLDEEGKRLLNTVRANTSRMAQLIDDILNFSRTGRSEMTSSEIDMEKMAREVFEELQTSASSGLQFEIEHIPPVTGDRAMMRQVFVNLLSNAVKFSSTRESPRIKVGAVREGNETVYFVKDNGVGFNMQYANKLFGVFQRLHSVNEFEGTGIGLAIVKRIITRHGGRVWAEGKINEGTTIYFAIPASDNIRQ